MLAAPLRKTLAPWSGRAVLVARSYSGNDKLKGKSTAAGRSWKKRPLNGDAAKETRLNEKTSASGPSLVEQLFPEEEALWSSNQQLVQDGELPRVPLEQQPATYVPDLPRQQATSTEPGKSRGAQLEEDKRRAQGEGTSILVLRNASPNLLDDDFRRIIPQGQHMEGWTLKEGDITRIVPARDMVTLAPTGHYYLFFTSPLSAFSYQGHAQRLHVLAASQAPRSLLSPLAPPPGYQVDGIDAHAAIQSFSLTPPSQTLELRQLQEPLTPVMQEIMRHGGYPHLVKRKDRMPFEARLTLDGPQSGRLAIQSAINFEGRKGLYGWTPEDGHAVQLIEWVPPDLTSSPSAMSRSPDAWNKVEAVQKHGERDMGVVMQGMTADLLQRVGHDEAAGQRIQKARVGTDGRPEKSVYIVGFHTERAMQSFVRHWHRRPLSPDTTHTPNASRSRFRDDMPSDEQSIANVEVLW